MFFKLENQIKEFFPFNLKFIKQMLKFRIFVKRSNPRKKSCDSRLPNQRNIKSK